ncbi:ABC transporter ATP-binding protein [Citrobacter sp. CK190]|uniref:ABC transporter ATP-binding protein n=1 Tax=Citrobacter TaxID=544 RepID=UPI001CC2FFA7|nr:MULTISPECIES: ABC transporter ATP-binding protein [Citrobacter]MDM2990905.1 ABC transporter ATP-binding protein [Citrobacter sp. CK190]WQD99224.1 ABC transporter ATP-binding protein [Citrobacter koseri]
MVRSWKRLSIVQFVASSDNPASALSVNIASLQRPGGGELLCAIRFEVEEGKCLAVIGPNGSGKTSLLRAISQELPLQKGDIQLLGRSVSALSRQQRAKQIAVLAQNDTPDLRLALEDYVALGRIPHAGDAPRDRHDAIVTKAIKETGLLALRKRSLSALSGGERQRAALARVLAQMPSLVLLDEPTNHLDPSGRVELLSLVKNKGITVVAVLHDLSLIESFADRVLLLSQGRMVLCDTPERVLVSENLYPVFGLTCFTVPHPDTGKALRIFEVPGYA